MTQENELFVEQVLERLRESKESTIKKCANLTDEQKQILIDYFTGPGQAWWSKIDWNRAMSKKNPLTWEDFQPVLQMASVGGLVYGEDYKTIMKGTFNGEEYIVYQPLSHHGAEVLESNRIPPERHDMNRNGNEFSGATWCIGWQKSDQYWNRYTQAGDEFYFVFGESIPTKKVALQMSNDGSVVVWDYTDSTAHPVKFEELPPEVQKAVNDRQGYRKEHVLEELINKIKRGDIKGISYNEETQRFDIWDKEQYSGSWFSPYELAKSICSKSDEHILIPIGVWGSLISFQDDWFTRQEDLPYELHGSLSINRYIENFDFSHMVVKGSCELQIPFSVKRLPKRVGENLVLNKNIQEDSLEGISTESCKILYLVGSNIKNLKGCPKCTRIAADESALESLEGCPETLKSLDVSDCKNLKSLAGCAKKILNSFDASRCALTSMEGGPTEGFRIGYYVQNNQITSFAGCPRDIEGEFNVSNNNISSMEGAPDEIGNGIYLRGNPIPREEAIEYIRAKRG